MNIQPPHTDTQDAAANKASSVKDIEVDRQELDRSIADFVDRNPDYYAKAFYTIHDTTAPPPAPRSRAVSSGGSTSPSAARARSWRSDAGTAR